MFNPMLAGIIAGGAFLVSFTLGLFGRTHITWAVFRALLFGGAFFGIVAGIYFLYNKFLSPEATAKFEGEKEGQTGHNVDYSIGDDDAYLNGLIGGEDADPGDISTIAEDGNMDSGDFAKPVEDATPENSGGEAADSGDAPDGSVKNAGSGDIDYGALEQSNDKGYNDNGDSALANKAAGFSDDGYDMDMSAFVPGLPGFEDDGDKKPEYPLYSPRSEALPETLNEGPVSLSVDTKSGKTDLDLDFNKQKMAVAIQTLLKKDEG